MIEWLISNLIAQLLDKIAFITKFFRFFSHFFAAGEGVGEHAVIGEVGGEEIGAPGALRNAGARGGFLKPWGKFIIETNCNCLTHLPKM